VWVLGEGHAETTDGHNQVLVALTLGGLLEDELQDVDPAVDANSGSPPATLPSYALLLVREAESEYCGKSIMLDRGLCTVRESVQVVLSVYTALVARLTKSRVEVSEWCNALSSSFHTEAT
jgi:hypothetical protein